MAKSVVVIGAGVGGLSAAIYARLQGWDVLVMEQQDRVGGKAAGIEIDGYWLDPGPSIIILPEIYDAVFRAAQRDPRQYLTFHRLPTLSRVFRKDEAALDLPADAEACFRLLQEIAPSDVPAFRELLRKLDQVVAGLEKAVFERPILHYRDLARSGLLRFGLALSPFRSYRSLIDRWFQSPIMRAFFYGFPSYSGQSFDDPAPGALLVPYYMLRRGVYFPTGGVRAIPLAFERLARELGVEFRFGARFDRFDGETSIRLTDGEAIHADGFICNLDRLTALKEENLTPSLSYFTLHYGVRKRLPELAHHNLFIPEAYKEGLERLNRNEFPHPPTVYVNATQELDPHAAPPDCSNLMAVVTVPSEGPTIDWIGKRAEYRHAIRSELGRHGIDWDECDQVFERVQDPLYFAQAHGNYRGSLYGPIQSQRAFGLFPLFNWEPNHPRRAFCGGSVQPGAGLPMVTLSGKFAVDQLAKVL